jgi:hypothetical protein
MLGQHLYLEFESACGVVDQLFYELGYAQPWPVGIAHDE